jgi:SAM-dependent methyltransferase
MDPRDHWQGVYETKKPTEVSWYQATATLSLNLIQRVAPDRSAAIIDVGAGASTLVDGLLAAGYTNLTVLDVSAAALAEAATRLGPSAGRVIWREADVLGAALPALAYDVWHDRAVFHFLVDAADRARYVDQVRAAVREGGHVLVATFAEDGPKKCSGLDVVRYAPEGLHQQFGPDFQLVQTAREEHHTPTGATQPFIYCLCRMTTRSRAY